MPEPAPVLFAYPRGSRRRSLIGMYRSRPLIEHQCGRRPIFRRSGLLLVVTARRRGFRPPGADGLHIAGKLPDLLGRHLLAEGRHSVRPAVADRCDDRHHFQAVIPPAVEKRRSGTALSVRMTAL